MRRFLVLICLGFTLVILSACGSGGDSESPQNTSSPDEDRQPEPDDPPPPGGESRSDAREAAELLRQPLAECPERVWPSANASYETAQVVITDTTPEGREAYLWQANHGDPRIETLDPESLSDEWFSSFTFSSDFRGEKALGFNVGEWHGENIGQSEDLWQTAISSLFHESFHWFADTEWNIGFGSRDAEYPVRWEPRYVRAQLMRALERALVDGEELAAASYWYERHLADYADEAVRIAPTDITEGAARYADLYMVAIAARGCDASEAVLLDEVRANLPNTHHRTAASSESYVIGALAGALLRERGPDNWQSRVEEGETIQGVLLDGVVPEEQPDNPQLREQIRTQATSLNNDLEQQLGESLEQLQGDSHYRLVLDSVKSIGAYTKNGSFMLVEQPLLESVDRDIEGQYDHGATVSLNEIDTFRIDGSPCQAGFAAPIMVLVPDSAITFHTDGTADASGTVQFSGLEVETVTWNELEWLCPLE